MQLWAEYDTREQSSQVRISGCRSGYSRIASTKSLSFCVTTCSANLTNITVLLSQSHDSNYDVDRRILALPPLRLQKQIDVLALSGFCDISLGLLTLSATEAGDFVELILLYLSMFRQHGFFFGLTHSLPAI